MSKCADAVQGRYSIFVIRYSLFVIRFLNA